MHMGPLKKRQVVGLWSGSEADIDLLLRVLKEKARSSRLRCGCTLICSLGKLEGTQLQAPLFQL